MSPKTRGRLLWRSGRPVHDEDNDNGDAGVYNDAGDDDNESQERSVCFFLFV